MSEYAVPLDDAMARLDVLPDYDAGSGPEPCVHTFAESGFGLLGAHWPVDSLRDLMAEHGVETAGEAATAMGHGLVVLRPSPHGPLFIATKDGEES